MQHFGVSHEAASLRRVLIHTPRKELKEANADPKRHGFAEPVEIERFSWEHSVLVGGLEEAGVEVLDVRSIISDKPEAEDIGRCPNLVFTRDTSAVTNAGVILMRMGLPSRRLETPIIRAVYEELRIPLGLELKPPETFEGGGLAIIEGKTAIAGLCSRTTRGALEAVKTFLLGEVVDLFILLNLPQDDIHIDGDFAELPGKTALIHTPTLDYAPAEFYTPTEMWRGYLKEWLREEGWDLIEITDQERLDMAANILVVHRDLAIHCEGNQRVVEEIRERGMEVIQIPGKEMKKGNGGVHCMTCPILRA